MMVLATGAFAEPSTLSSEAIRQMVSGTIVDIDTPIGTILPFRYATDGKLTGEAPSLAWYLGASTDRGTWWVERNRLCHKWSVWFRGKPQCLRIRQDGQRFYWRNDDGDDGTASIRERFAPAVVAHKKPAPQKVLTKTASKPDHRETPKAAAAAEPQAPVAVAEARTPEPPREAPRQFATAALAVAAAPPPPNALPAAGSKPALTEARPAETGKPTTTLPAAAPARPAEAKPMAKAMQAATPKSKDFKPAAKTSAPLPPSFRVAGVEPFDVLNVRSGPSADFNAVGAIPPEARGVAITGPCRQDWCPVRHRDTRGWVNSFYLIEDVPAQGASAPASRIVRR